MTYRVLKENDLFLLTDEKGDITSNHPYELGLYTKDTRMLSQLELKINGEEPIALHSSGAENVRSVILLTNPHQEQNGDLILWRESIELKRERFIANGVLYEMITVASFFPKEVSFEISLHLDADFTDMFIARGFQYGEIGSARPAELTDEALEFHYDGADNIKRRTRVQWNEAPSKATKDSLHYDITLEHGHSRTITLMIQPLIGEENFAPVDRQTAWNELKASHESWNKALPKFETGMPAFNELIQRGTADLRVLMTDVGFGRFPVAGLPWFGVPFGRDSIIAALQLLPFASDVAKGTLRTMAHYQGTKNDPWRDEQPGKIMHEIRYGELANTNQVPFTPYYGTVDATPLFLMLLVEYVKWTGDQELFKELSPNVEAALQWIDQYGDRDGDGFVEYHQESEKGIANQGWKDSGDSIVHRNGDYAASPIALSEVQGYIYQAKTGLAELFEQNRETEKAKQLREQAQQLKEAYNEAFWMDDAGYYAIALDADKKQVGTITSNPGHTLWSGLVEGDRLDQVSKTLTSSLLFSGYGIRTMAEGEAGYNPMSYHDGSVWPHDNSMILFGLSKMRQPEAITKVIGGLIEASKHFEYSRLPELFCGYSKEMGPAVKYPVACSPQAWAAGTPLVFIQSLLGLFPDVPNKQISLHPLLLPGMDYLHVNDMQIGEGKLSVSIYRKNGVIKVEIQENTTGCEVMMTEEAMRISSN
ncbi:amylo-alpha-1,6-glucosidase [Domibacillus sp. A3M-37]|uniref:amylo-alpha-1,6-glucosidase n=1 Tax=Domibacillus sp. A3M-37 TaxID=2962037 RepID=UPI0020B8B1C2|nr:amylo-alpha-1,6-glucosidase [Domibacillus sp. A3M-37]MCP3761688.1 amylo-alpha-1,6-glucosidase [Domibacillus sp. A3M-37]